MTQHHELRSIYEKQRKYFETGVTLPLEFRLNQLRHLQDLILTNEALILEALYKDLRKPPQEAFSTEVAVLIDEIRHSRKNLRLWMKPQRVSTPVHLQPAKSEILSEPLGTTLILAPWNYPFQLTIAPLIGAIAAGNTAVLKPSELAPATSKVIAEIVGRHFSPDYIAVVEGGVPETTALLNLPFDHVFLTGSPRVGKIVMKAAAENLSKVTLELGGKSPVIVTRSADLDLAAKRIAWGKFLNAGQTCVAPDYVYVEESILDDFVQKLGRSIKQHYSEDPARSAHYGRIINETHFRRLVSLLEGLRPVYGGQNDLSDLYIAPTVVTGVKREDPLMKEEIFGPLLPVLSFKSLDEAFAGIRSDTKPLAAYCFANDKKEQERFLSEISFGGGCINDTLLHLASPHLPFGGVGVSGSGSYHGHAGFRAFSHEKSVLHKGTWGDWAIRYPPYSEEKFRWLRRLLST